MNLKKYNVSELENELQRNISGGDRITRAVFGYFGRLFGHINAMMEADAQHGVRVY